MISKIKRIFQIFFKTKISFKKLEKKEILFFDISHVDILVNQFKLKYYWKKMFGSGGIRSVINRFRWYF